MQKGKVTYFNDLKGWGFIAPEHGESDVYVHHTDINMEGFRTLREGQEVVYELTKKGRLSRAANVTVAN